MTLEIILISPPAPLSGQILNGPIFKLMTIVIMLACLTEL